MLVQCAEEGDEAGVKQAVQAGALVDWVDRSGWAALHHAAASGNSGMVKLLLNYSADLEVRSTAAGEEGATPLHLAACFGNTVVMRVLLDSGAEEEAVDQRGKTAVHWAALQGKLESLKLLDAYNCDLKSRVSGRGTALHYAAAYGDLELVEWLVERGVEITNKDRNGRLAKDVAKRNGHMLVHHFLKKEAERQPQKSFMRAGRHTRTDNSEQPRPRSRKSTHREGKETPRQEHRDVNRSASLPSASKSPPPTTSKKKGWIIRSVTVGNKSGQKLQAEAMKKEMEDMEELLRSKDAHIARLQGDIFSTELEKVKVEEHLQELIIQTQRLGKPSKAQDAALEGTSDTGHTDIQTLLQEKASILRELQEVKTRLEEERRARASERQASDHKIASLTSELEEVTQKMTKYGVRQRKLLSKNKNIEPDLAAAGTPSGLPDVGDGGSMNSVVQCLYSVTDFRNYLTSDAYRRDLVSQGEASTALAGVFKALRAGVQPEIHAKVHRLKEVVGSLQRTSSRSHGHGAHGLLTYLFTRLQRDLWQVDEDSVSRKFLGSQVSTVTCRWTGLNVTRVAEDFSTISLDVTEDKKSSLQDLLAEHYQPLGVEHDCPHCVRSHQCRKEIKITRLPPVLVIQLSRNDQKTRTGFPSQLELQRIVSCNSSSYELFAVIALEGTAASPKYTALCRSPPDPTWRLYDDDRVRDVSVQSVLDTNNPHLLFYSSGKD